MVNRACLVAVGGGSTHSGLWVSRTCLVFGRQKIWLDPASEVTRSACLNPPRLPGLALCPTGLDLWPGVTPYESLPGWLNVLQDRTRNPRGSPIMTGLPSPIMLLTSHHCVLLGAGEHGSEWWWQPCCSWWSESQCMYPTVQWLLQYGPQVTLRGHAHSHGKSLHELTQKIMSSNFPSK